MVPAELLPARVAMPADPAAQSLHFRDELVARHVFEIVIHARGVRPRTDAGHGNFRGKMSRRHSADARRAPSVRAISAKPALRAPRVTKRGLSVGRPRRFETAILVRNAAKHAASFSLS